MTTWNVLFRNGRADRQLLESPDRLTYDGLAEALVQLSRPAEAEVAYRDAIARIPGDAAHFHFKLGEHYANGGRPAAALQAFAEAVRLDPTLKTAAEPYERKLYTASSGCLLRALPE